MSETNSDALLGLVTKVFTVFEGFDWLSSEELFWRTGGEHAPFKIFVKCNDLFHWATADLEEITLENIDTLEVTVDEVKALTGDNRHADELFCARVRGMRPQRPCYKNIDERLHPLFDACGPYRKE